MGASNCCSGAGENMEEQIAANKKETTPGTAKLPNLEVEPAQPAAVAARNVPKEAAPVSQKKEAPDTDKKSGAEFLVTLDKSNGTRLGVDVDNQDGSTLLIESISAGLVQEWNDKNSDEQVKVGDRIIEVNGIRNDLIQLVDECKKDQMLKVRIRRGA
mmetsp:Transcript_115321/g.180160  ORF Transcript_115321/g.180160 Transcript_115321/m.180160 type:complete len:158 (+) Transcript_115321:71-544(+)